MIRGKGYLWKQEQPEGEEEQMRGKEVSAKQLLVSLFLRLNLIAEPRPVFSPR